MFNISAVQTPCEICEVCRGMEGKQINNDLAFLHYVYILSRVDNT